MPCPNRIPLQPVLPAACHARGSPAGDDILNSIAVEIPPGSRFGVGEVAHILRISKAGQSVDARVKHYPNPPVEFINDKNPACPAVCRCEP